MQTLLDKIISKIFGNPQSKRGMPLLPEEEVLLQTVTDYSVIIRQYIPYFHLLTEPEKKRFIHRVWHFRKSKKFHFVDITESDQIQVLVSAAAVQLTFGLKKYRLSFFKDIYIMPDAYNYASGQPLYIGHVSPKGIYLSWKHFLQGFEDATDNVNVAIHEMAHALAYNNFLEEYEVDSEFRNDFAKLPAAFGPAIANRIVRQRSYLRPYAYTNIQEFWAVSVEAFFENPSALKDTMPGLYSVISEILNQDPLARHRIITTI
jgi:Mlc titration factor MtfA (ptsG expression regulator)